MKVTPGRLCVICGNYFSKNLNVSKKEWGKHYKCCSKRCSDDYKKRYSGDLNPFYGKKHTPETIKKLSELKIGHTPWNKGKKYPAITGVKNHNWKGGVSKISDKIRSSIEHRAWRRAVFKRDNYTCQFCNKRGVKLNADHIKPFSRFPKLRFDINNGRTLCVECHKGTDTYGFKMQNGGILKA